MSSGVPPELSSVDRMEFGELPSSCSSQARSAKSRREGDGPAMTGAARTAAVLADAGTRAVAGAAVVNGLSVVGSAGTAAAAGANTSGAAGVTLGGGAETTGLIAA